jgi:hypothetical protein
MSKHSFICYFWTFSFVADLCYLWTLVAGLCYLWCFLWFIQHLYLVNACSRLVWMLQKWLTTPMVIYVENMWVWPTKWVGLGSQACLEWGWMGEVVKGLDGLEFETNTMIIMVIPQFGAKCCCSSPVLDLCFFQLKVDDRIWKVA